MKAAALLVTLVVGALLAGPAGVDPAAVLYRAPRVAAAVVAGAGLAACGVAMQALLRNVLADPFILGMSGGASLGAVGAVLFAPLVPPAVAGAVGALLASALVTALGRTPEGGIAPTRLLLAGVAVSAALGALTQLLLQVAPQARAVRAALFWTSGSLGAVGLPALAVAVVVTTAGLFTLLRLAPALDRMLLGDQTAASLGVDVPRLRLALLVVTAGVTGALVALAGPIGFVGLAAPHLARLRVGALHRRLVPTAAVLGAALLLVADTGARAAFAPRELPTGVLTAALGGPFFVWLLRADTGGEAA